MKRNRSLRILHTESSCGWGGQEIRILNEASGLIRRGHVVEIACPPTSNIYSAAIERGLTVHPVQIKKKNLKALWHLYKWLKTNPRFDVVNTHSSTDSWLMALCNSISNKPIPLIRTRHVSTQVNKSITTKWLYKTATKKIVTTGEALKQQLHKRNGYSLNKMISIPTGVDFKIFSPSNRFEARKALNLAQSKFIIGIVATLRDWKGHSYLFQAYAKVQSELQDSIIVIVGDGPHESKLKNQINELGIEKNVIFTGRQKNISQWLNSFDIFCLPSYGEEGVPQALLQAMSCSLPSISTNVGSIKEAIIDGQTGIIVPPKNVKELSKNILKLSKSLMLREQLGNAALHHVRNNFSEQSMLDNMEQAFLSTADTISCVE